MKKETAATLLALIFILFTGLRIAIAFSQPTLTYDGYKELRYVDHIADTGLPLRDDQLSYGGRTHIYSPLYYYLLAPFAIAIPSVIVLKFIPNLLFGFAILLVYFITHDLTRSRGAGLLAAGLAGFTPIVFSQYINDADPLSISVPLMLLMIYALVDIKARLPLLIITGIMLSLTGPLIFIVMLGIGLYLAVAALERLSIEPPYVESLLFFLFFSLWSMLIIYKEPILQQGIAALWTYLPSALFKTYFSEFTLVTAIATVGLLPIGFGVLAGYHALFHNRARKVLLVAGLTAAIILVLLVRLIDIRTGMLILALLFCILAGQGFRLLSLYFNKTKVPWSKYVIIGLLLLFFVFSSAIPALSSAGHRASDVPSPEFLVSTDWLADQTDSDSRILAMPKEGFVIQHEARRQTLIDNDFLLVENVDATIEELERIYKSQFAIPALDRLNKNGIDYIFFSAYAAENYGLETLQFTDHECYTRVFQNDEVRIYEVVCDVRTE